jgi:hypothetical protein
MPKIIFREEDHSYLGEKNGSYVPFDGSTTWLSQWIKPFPKDFIAPKSAAKNLREGLRPTTTEGVLDMWRMSGDIACDYGNSIHKAIEYYIKYGQKVKAPHLLAATNSFIDLGLGDCVSEFIMGDADTELAGQADIIEKYKDGVNLLDIKTNSDLYDHKGYLLPPFDEYKCNNLNKYRLQLSLYKYFLEKEGHKVYNMRLLWWTGSEFESIDIDEIDLSSVLSERIEMIKNK